MRFSFNVTEEHIRNGVPWSFNRCPVALALRGLGFTDIHVGASVVCFRGRTKYEGSLSQRMNKFVDRVDSQSKKVKPVRLGLILRKSASY